MKTKLFLDTEFTQLKPDTTLISLALVSECGKSFYAEFSDYDKTSVNDWIEDYVINNLKYNHLDYYCSANYSNKEIKDSSYYVKVHLKNWLEFHFPAVEIWGDCLAYDWFLFCNLFGGAMRIPKQIYYIPFDLSTLLLLKGVDPDINRLSFADAKAGVPQHNALRGAELIRDCYFKAIKM